MQAMMIGLMRMAQSIGAAAAQIPEQDSTILYSRTSFTIGIKKSAQKQNFLCHSSSHSGVDRIISSELY